MVSKENSIRAIVKASVQSFAQGFSDRHISEFENPDGTINMKIHNVFIAKLWPEIQYYTSLVRSLDSSLWNMLESMAINISELSYQVEKRVEWPLYPGQTTFIATLLEKYKRHEMRPPKISDYQDELRDIDGSWITEVKRHESDYFLTDIDTKERYLIELKIGGDLDNKKARSEKEALLEQYAILCNTLDRSTKVKIFFGTAYNRYGEGKARNQQRVKQFFADEELLIGRDFWNFICKMQSGYDIVINEYEKNAHFIIRALDSIKLTYLW